MFTNQVPHDVVVHYTGIITEQVQHKLLIFFFYAISANNGIRSHHASASSYSLQISFNQKPE